MFVEVLVNKPIEGTFWYHFGKNSSVSRYQRVSVIFSSEKVTGLILDLVSSPKGKRLGEVISVIDKEPVFSDEQLELAKFISRYYTSTLSEAVFMMIPDASRVRTITTRFSDYNICEDTKLTQTQDKVYRAVKSAFGVGEVFLLYGVTGSGKTEIYKKLVRDVLNEGKSCLLLVPEISLTPQLVDKFSFVPKELIAVYHSRLTENDKFNIYMSVKNGLKKFVIGPRSSLFLPYQNLGIIIVDEFHETSYKSSSTPRYSVKDIVKWISKNRNIPVVLGSATPTIEDFYLAKQGEYKLLELKEKFAKYQKVEVEVVDMKKDKSVVSPIVISKISEKVSKNQQVIVFINRRGFSDFVKCNNCGYVPMCPNCDITLTYHKQKNILLCHHCGYTEKYSEVCRSCSIGRIITIGAGTERAEEIIKNIFIKRKIVRVDLDTTKDKEAYDRIYSALKTGEIDVIIGTQIVSKGLDIPQVNLVCILFPEITLRLPDFYSSERTFHLITQAIGRSGRRDEKGHALIQTSDADHYSIKAAVAQDYELFFEYEIERRRNFKYPPFWNMTKFVFRSEVEKKCIEIGNSAKILLDNIAYKRDDVIVSPLVPAPIKRIANNYRYQIIFKSTKEELIEKAQEVVYKSLRNKLGVYIEIDRNPLSLL
ncbi:MAG: primosomal protein N' [Brevinematales bacterium]|nr:primosomal protein N' [Brevinematales bacterium]